MRKNIILMASGTGSLAQAVIDAVRRGEIEADISAIVCDKPMALVIERATAASIPTFVHPMKKERALWNSELIDYMDSLHPDLVVSVGFMRVLSPEFVARFSTINSHPSLLPLFPGAHAVSDALKAGATETGTTVHWVDEGVDTGKIIGQVRVPVLPHDDEEALHERIKIVERELIVETVKKVLTEINPPAKSMEN